MSFQAYLDNIKAKTGKTADDFKAMATEKGLTTTSEIMQWLKSEYALGHGHAMAIVHLVVHEEDRKGSPDDKMNKLFAGNKAKWHKIYTDIWAKVAGFGPDATASPGQTYINLLRNGKKFAIIQPSSAERLDIGIKLKSMEPEGRFEAAGPWNSMVTHRVRINEPGQVNDELLMWLKQAYQSA